MILITTSGHQIEIDDDDFDLVKGFTWSVIKSPCTNYAISRDKGGRKVKKTHYYMHRVIMNAPKGTEVDHVDGNGLNNHRNNLRICSRAQNQHNRQKTRRQTSSEYKGVSWNKKDARWRAAIVLNSKQIHIGSFSTEHDAAIAYNNTAIRLFGGFAKINNVGHS